MNLEEAIPTEHVIPSCSSTFARIAVAIALTGLGELLLHHTIGHELKTGQGSRSSSS